MSSQKMLSHVVFFTLKDSSQAAIDHLVEECHRYLKNHPGVVAFFAGTLAAEYARLLHSVLLLLGGARGPMRREEGWFSP